MSRGIAQQAPRSSTGSMRVADNHGAAYVKTGKAILNDRCQIAKQAA